MSAQDLGRLLFFARTAVDDRSKKESPEKLLKEALTISPHSFEPLFLLGYWWVQWPHTIKMHLKDNSLVFHKHLCHSPSLFSGN
jgi:hypothetical protein